MSVIKKPKDILEEIQSIFEDIKEGTGWESTKLPSDIKIEIGDAPEYHENFGVVRKRNKLVFGKWIDEVEPKAVSNHFWEFLIIRESFSFYFSDDLLFGDNSQLVNFFLNLLALSYLQMSDPVSARDIKFFPIQGRFLLPKENKTSSYKEIYSNLNSLIEIINQGTSYKMLLNTFNSFIEELKIEEIDSDEVFADLRRYLSNDAEEIAAPIFLKKSTLDVFMKLIKYGFETSANKIAKTLEMNQSTVTRQIAKLSSKFYARWRLEKNYSKLGLYSYILIIRYPTDNESVMNEIFEDFIKIKYFREFYEGKNNKFNYHYAVIHCPHLISERIAKKLSKHEDYGLIDSFEIKIIKDRIFKTNIVSKPFKPTFSNFTKLINGEISSKKLSLWDMDHHKNKEKELYEKKDENILNFISIVTSKSLSQSSLFGVHIKELQSFLEENVLSLKNQSECQTFVNKLQNQANEMGLIDYRFIISLTGVASSNLTFFRINSNQESKEIDALIDKISVFGWSLVIKSLDCVYFLYLGPDYEHSLSKHIGCIIEESGFSFECFSVKQKIFRFVDYNLLYDYSSQKWLL